MKVEGFCFKAKNSTEIHLYNLCGIEWHKLLVECSHSYVKVVLPGSCLGLISRAGREQCICSMCLNLPRIPTQIRLITLFLHSAHRQEYLHLILKWLLFSYKDSFWNSWYDPYKNANFINSVAAYQIHELLPVSNAIWSKEDNLHLGLNSIS